MPEQHLEKRGRSMAYKLNITEHADELLDNLVYHLIYRLKNKQATKHLLDGIDVIYDRLEVNPFQFSECRDVYLARKIRIGHSDRKAWVPFCVLILNCNPRFHTSYLG